MKLILLSGGSGKRLWPMSNDSRSKQFLRVLTDEQGNRVSMLQRVWGQIKKVNLHQQTYICSSKAQREMIESQVGITPFIEEPARRDTFAAIALASTYLTDMDGIGEDEVVAVVPIDHFVDDSYFETISALEKIISESKAELVLMGVTPTESTSKFGYITTVVANPGESWFRVASFVEKPSRDQARAIIARGALWNCGVFCFRLGYMKTVLSQKGLPTNYTDVIAQFLDFPKRSFDHEVVESAKSIVVCQYNGQWKDLGTWGSLAEEFVSDFVGKGTTVGCENTHSINELGIPLITMGLKNVIVVSAPDGILVADKHNVSDIKDAIGNFEGRPMYEERRWGSYRVLDYQKLDDGTEVLTKTIELQRGHNLSYQKHLKRSEVWTFIEGTGEIALDKRIFQVSPGDVVRVYPEQWHAIRATNTLKFIEVQRGSELIEEDIVRRFSTWEDVLDYCSVPSL